jgi:hypothetical protein
MHPYCRANVDVLHILRGDKYVLLSIGRVGCVNLKRGLNGLGSGETLKAPHHHLHADVAVDGIHEHIEHI